MATKPSSAAAASSRSCGSRRRSATGFCSTASQPSGSSRAKSSWASGFQEVQTLRASSPSQPRRSGRAGRTSTSWTLMRPPWSERPSPARARLGDAAPRHPGGRIIGRALASGLVGLADLGERPAGLRGSRQALGLDLQEDLLAEHRHAARRLDPKADLLPEHREHRDLDVVADHDALVRLAGEHQHVPRPPDAGRGGVVLRPRALVSPVGFEVPMNGRGGWMLYGRRLDQALQHVDGSRYALVHAVAKRARQITLWLTADPAELRAEAAPPPAPGELVTRDPVALAESEILQGEVVVRWDPEGRADEAELLEIDEIETDPLLIEGLAEDDDVAVEGDDGDAAVTPALAQVLEAEQAADEAVAEESTDDDQEPVEAEAEAEAESLALGDPDEIEEISLEDVDEPDDDVDEDEPEV